MTVPRDASTRREGGTLDPEPPHPDRVDPAVLNALLARHGWERRGGVPGRYARWTPPGSETYPAERETSLLVPQGHRLEDYTDLLDEALTALAHSAVPSARQILLGLTIPGDEIRWHRDAPELAGAVAWSSADRLRTTARAMLMAAARADCVPAAYYGQRYARYAAGFVDQLLLGPSLGGNALTTYIPTLEGRGTTLTLLRSLQAVRDAIDYRHASGSMELFDVAVRVGVCRELTRAVVRLLRGSQGAEVSLSWSPTAGPPQGFSDRTQAVAFAPSDIPVLRAAGDRYRQSEPAVLVRITGAVVRLRRPRPTAPGAITLRVLAGADVRHVRMRLDEDAYRTAANAHLTGLPIHVSGRLESRGGFRTLTGAHDVSSAHVDEAEREQMLKSIQGQAEFIEEACHPDD
jgi:hypothetical protein